MQPRVTVTEDILKVLGVGQDATEGEILAALRYRLEKEAFLQDQFLDLSQKLATVFDEAFYMGCKMKDRHKVNDALSLWVRNKRRAHLKVIDGQKKNDSAA